LTSIGDVNFMVPLSCCFISGCRVSSPLFGWNMFHSTYEKNS